MTRFRLSAFLAISVVAVLLTGCGFHLRNRIALPVDLGPVLVTSNVRYSQLPDTIQRGLQASGATIAADGSQDVATLRVVSERWGDRPIAIDNLGRAQEYSLRYAVIFSFTRADGSVLVPQQVIELSRDYVSPPQNATGTSTEREILADELRREMSASILRRIDSVMRLPPEARPVESGETAPPAPAPIGTDGT